MQDMKQRLKSPSRAAKGIFAIFAGSVSGQLILLLATPILSRIYTPAEFGAFAVVTAIAGVTSNLATLGLASVIPLPPSVDETRHIVRLGIFSSVVISAASGFVVPFLSFGDTLEELALAPLWVALTALVVSLFSIFTQAALRSHSYGLVASRSPIQSTGIAVSQLALGFANFTSFGLVAGAVIGRIAGFFAIGRAALPLLRKPESGSARRSLKRYWKFPVLFMPANFINTLGTEFPLLLISQLYIASAAGNLSMAQRFAFIPAALVGMAIGQVFLAELAQKVRDEEGGYLQLFLRTSLLLAGLGLAVGIGFFFLAPPLLPWLLGDAWIAAGEYVRAMAISCGLGVIVSPVSIVFLVFERAGLNLGIIIGRLILFVGATAFIVSQSLSAIQAIWILYGVQAAMYLIIWLIALITTMKFPAGAKSSTH